MWSVSSSAEWLTQVFQDPTANFQVLLLRDCQDVLSQTSPRMLPMAKHLYKLGVHDITTAFIYYTKIYMYKQYRPWKYTQIFFPSSENFSESKAQGKLQASRDR